MLIVHNVWNVQIDEWKLVLVVPHCYMKHTIVFCLDYVHLSPLYLLPVSIVVYTSLSNLEGHFTGKGAMAEVSTIVDVVNQFIQKAAESPQEGAGQVL